MAKQNTKSHQELLDRIRKNTTIDEAEVLADSKFFNDKDMIQTPIFMLNVALSGTFEGGLYPGHTMFAGPSKHFKTGLQLILMAAYLKKYPEAIALFYDSEFGTGMGQDKTSYFDTFGIPKNRVLHSPITNIEQLKFDIMNQVDNIKRGDKLFIGIDSIGNLASKKEVEDTLNEKSVADMTRAKQLKSLFRMVTPHLNIKDIPLVTVNHTYKEIGLFPKDVVGGGTGSYYSADNIFIIGRKQEKDGDDLSGYKFMLKVEKSRFVQEKSIIPLDVDFKKGVSKWSGLLDVALESGHVVDMGGKPKKYEGNGVTVSKESTENKEFWFPILSEKSFQDFVRAKYKLETPKEPVDVQQEETTEE